MEENKLDAIIRKVNGERKNSMKLGEQLAKKRKKAVEDAALCFAINIQEQLQAVAEQGGNEYSLTVKESEMNLVTSRDFLAALELLLEGVKVEIVETRMFTLLTNMYLKLSWGEE